MEDVVVDLNNFMTDSTDMTYHIDSSTVNPGVESFFADSNKSSANKEEVDSEGCEDLLRKRLTHMIDQLNLAHLKTENYQNKTVTVLGEAWNNFKQLKQVYTLEGESDQWMACLVFMAYFKIMYLKKMSSSKVAETTASVANEYELNLNKLLNLSNLKYEDYKELFSLFFAIFYLNSFGKSSISFLESVKVLVEILRVPRELCLPIGCIEAKINVSRILFAKYQLIFSHLFNCYSTAHTTNSEDSVKTLFEFGWLFFITIKENYPNLGNDLVNSYHLLICAINLMYENVIRKSRRLDGNILLLELDSHQYLIDYLCKRFDGQSLEVKTINEHYFKPQVSALGLSFFFNMNDKESLLAMVDKLNRVYEDLLKPEDSSKQFSNLDQRFFLRNIQESFDKQREKEQGVGMKLGTNMKISLSKVESTDDGDFKENLKRDEDVICQVTVPKCLTVLCGMNQASLHEANRSYVEHGQLFDVLKSSVKQMECQFRNGLLANSMAGDEDQTSQLDGFKKCLLIRHVDGIELLKLDIRLIVDYLIEIASVFFYKVLSSLLDKEKTRLGTEAFNTALNTLLKSPSLSKSLYICCLEVLLNFCTITIVKTKQEKEFLDTDNEPGKNQPMYKRFKTNDSGISTSSQSFPISTYLSNNNSDKFKFPWSLSVLDLNGYEMFRVIELFIKSTSLTNAMDPTHDLLLMTTRDMIRHLSKIEEAILETHGWSTDSTVWSEISQLEITPEFLKNNEATNKTFMESNLQYKIPFPLFEDVNDLPNQVTGGSNSLSSSSSVIPNSRATNNTTNSNSEIILNLTPNPVTSSATATSFSSPVKHPTITRVVCSGPTAGMSSFHDSLSANSRNSATNNTQNQRQTTQKTPTRLANTNQALTYFFRKFYNLTNLKMRELVENLDLVSKLTEATNRHSQAPAQQLSTQSSTNPAITPIIGNNSLNNQSIDNQQAILRTIWNIFEYSMCHPETDTKTNTASSYLLCDRHVDQLLLCSVYLACKLLSLGVSFTEIIRVYRSLPNAHPNHIYRKVLVSKLLTATNRNRFSDLVIFYNETFIRVLKPFAVKINELERAMKQQSKLSKVMKKSQSMGDLVCLSPVPKLQTPTILQTHFTPVKLNVNNESNVFVSPGKLTGSLNQFLTPQSHHSTSNLNQSSVSCSQLTFIQPFQQQQRNKLTFSLKDLNPNKSICRINEIIKENELKMKPTTTGATINKQRLFASDIHQLQTTVSGSSADIDETDGDGATTSQRSVLSSSLGLVKQKPMNVIDKLANINSNSGLKFTSFPRPSPTTSFLSTVVGTKLGFTSRNSPNLVTMVISNNNKDSPKSTTPNNPTESTSVSTTTTPTTGSAQLGYSFTRKLQNIQNERLN